MVEDFLGFFKVWYNRDLMVTILLLSEVRKKFRITMYTNIESIINVHLEEEKVIRFKEVESERYLFNSNNKSNIYYF